MFPNSRMLFSRNNKIVFMKIIGLTKLTAFYGVHTDCKAWIENWVTDVRTSTWKTSQDIKNRYNSVSFLKNNIVIFNVKGNSYRLETNVAYGVGVVSIVWIGTHAQYSQRYS